jgi:hypothetical protein
MVVLTCTYCKELGNLPAIVQKSPHLAKTGVLFQELKTARGDLL